MGQPVAPVNPNQMINPWAVQAGQDTATAQGLQMGGQQGAQNAIDMMGQYPAMTNSYGLGGQQSPAVPGSASNPAFGAQPITVTVPDTASRGFNPWSLTGEANARGK